MLQTLRVLSAVAGAVLALVTAGSVVRTLVVPRGRSGLVQSYGDLAVERLFGLVTRRVANYEERDRIRAAQGPAYLVLVLAVWLVGLLVGFALVLWPWTRNLPGSFRESGSSLFTLGFDSSAHVGPTVVDLLAAATGLAVVALQVSYLPSIYAAFSRRETEVTLLGARAGAPPWGPELLARTRLGLHAESELDELYRRWERWGAEVAESHSNYPVLVRFRSPRADTNWLVALLAVLDCAALFHALAPSRAPVSGRLVLRMGWTCLWQIADSIGLAYDPDPRPDAPLQLTEAEFRTATARLDEVGFPRERDDEAAWAHFRGWRVNYEALAYRLCSIVDAVPALWSGPRRTSDEMRPPVRPAVRTPEDPDGTASRGRPRPVPEPARREPLAP